MEKTPLSSKKFIAFFASLAVIAGVLITALVTQSFGWPMVAFMTAGITGICALAIDYIGKQGSLDKFMRGLKGIVNVRQDNNNEPME